MKCFVILIFGLIVLSSATAAQKPPKGDSNVPATTTVFDAAADTSPYRIQSDQLGTYANGIDSVVSIIQGIGDWEMDAKSSSVRRVFIDFGDPASSGAEAPFGSAWVPTRFISKCTDRGFKVRDMALGESRDCPLATSFDFGGSTYRITMNHANFVSTNYVSWTCLATANGRCTGWEINPAGAQPSGELKARAQLIKVGTSRRNPDQFLGEFFFSFRISVTTP